VTVKTKLNSNFVYVTLLLFHSSLNGQYFKDYHKFLESSDWITSVPLSGSFLLNGLRLLAGKPFVKGSPTGACKKQELKQFDVEISHHWTSWQRWKKGHKYYNTLCKFYPSDRAKGPKGAEGWNAYTPVIYLNKTRCCKYFSFKWT